MTSRLITNPLPGARLMARLAARTAPKQMGTFMFDALLPDALLGAAWGYESPKSGSQR